MKLEQKILPPRLKFTADLECNDPRASSKFSCRVTIRGAFTVETQEEVYFNISAVSSMLHPASGIATVLTFRILCLIISYFTLQAFTAKMHWSILSIQWCLATHMLYHTHILFGQANFPSRISVHLLYLPHSTPQASQHGCMRRIYLSLAAICLRHSTTPNHFRHSSNFLFHYSRRAP